MSRFLVYFSEQTLQGPEMNAILKNLNQIGTPQPADFNVYAVETEHGGQAVFEAIESAASKGDFFVADVAEISYRGDGQFSGALRHFL